MVETTRYDRKGGFARLYAKAEDRKQETPNIYHESTKGGKHENFQIPSTKFQINLFGICGL
jgi:hypothetical protein